MPNRPIWWKLVHKKDDSLKKLDGVGPVDNRPSTEKLHHFVQKKMTYDIWHVTRDMWHVTREGGVCSPTIWLDKVAELVGGGSIIKGAYSV